jgi:hypothetical protein
MELLRGARVHQKRVVAFVLMTIRVVRLQFREFRRVLQSQKDHLFGKVFAAMMMVWARLDADLTISVLPSRTGTNENSFIVSYKTTRKI